MQKPVFHKRIFWDVDFENIDYDKRFKFVIERVFDRGDVDDIRQCRRYYGDELVKEVLMNAKFISERRMSLVAAIIDVPVNELKCYKLRQSNPTLYPY